MNEFSLLIFIVFLSGIYLFSQVYFFKKKDKKKHLKKIIIPALLFPIVIAIGMVFYVAFTLSNAFNQLGQLK